MALSALETDEVNARYDGDVFNTNTLNIESMPAVSFGVIACSYGTT